MLIMSDVAHLRAALAGKTAFVTGHSGFIGSWLATVLDEMGMTVVGYSTSDDTITASRAGALERAGVRDIRGDVRDTTSLYEAMDEAQPDVVFHLAAQALLPLGFDEPHMTFDVNVNGSNNVLEAMRMGLAGSLVHVTSDKCYVPMEAENGPLTESSPLGGRSPYSSSKTMCELMFGEYAELTRRDGAANRMASIRLGNVIGGGDYAHRLVPNCVKAFQEGRSFSVRDPFAVRPFQHVLDVVEGFVRMAARLETAQGEAIEMLNFAPPAAGYTAGEMVAQLARAWGPTAILDPQPEHCDFPEDKLLWLDGAKAAQLLEWNHVHDLADAADRIVEWVQMVDDGLAPAQATRLQAIHQLEAHSAPTLEQAA